MRKKIGFITSQEKSTLIYGDRLTLPFFENKDIEVKSVIWDSNSNLNSLELLVIRSCWDYHLKITEFIKWLNFIENSNIKVLNPISVIKDNLDKKYLLALQKKSVLIPKTVLIEARELKNLKNILKENNFDNIVLKPTISASADNTFLTPIKNLKLFETEIEKIVKNSSLLVQEFIPEIQTQGELSLVFFNKKYSHAVIKRPTKDDFRVQEKYGGKTSSITLEPHIIKQAESILNTYEHELLYARVDGIIREQKFYLMELELIEPDLFLEYYNKAPEKFFKAIMANL